MKIVLTQFTAEQGQGTILVAPGTDILFFYI
jgi:hypothetical protein